MKRKNLSKKLVLNKTTVSNLRMDEMRQVLGGEWTSAYPITVPNPTCDTCGSLCITDCIIICPGIDKG